MNNFYFYRLENSTSHVFIAWDEDNAFLQPDFGITTRLDENVLTRKSSTLPAYRSQYFSVLLGGGDVGGGLAAAGDAAAVRPDQRGDARRHPQARTRTPSTPPAARRCSRFPPPRLRSSRCEVARATGAARPAGCP